jgi:antitoxin VapB
MPMIYVEQISDRRVDEFLFANGHKMGPCHRPIGTLKEHGLFVYDQLRAVAITADLVAETCGGLRRSEAIELARLCADDPALCRVMLRLWREVIFPAFGRPWAVSYQDEKLHTGNTYRFDGWRKIATGQRSGTDQRSNRKGRTKTVWAWNKDSASLKALGEERPSPIRVSQP